MSHGQPRILFLTLSDDIGSERIVCEMGRRGAVCAVMGRSGVVAARALGVSLHHRLPAAGGAWMAARRVGRGLERMVARWRPDAVVPLDDMAAGVLRDLATAPRTGGAVRALVERSLGDPRHYPTACSRARLIEAAQALGIRTPAQRPVRDRSEAAAAAADLGFPLMIKREGTCGGSGVTLVKDGGALASGFEAAARRARAKRALRRVFGFRPDRDAAAVTVQAHVPGTLAMLTVACERGIVLDGIGFAADLIDPPLTGSSTVVRPLHEPEMEEAARRLVAALGCSGFVSFDFILAPDGAPRLIEMNARPVGSGHLGARFGRDLYGAWLRRFPGFRDAAPPEAAAAAGAVALFPKEMMRDPASPLAAAVDVLHDVPWDEPLVIDAYRDRLLLRHPGAEDAVARRLGPAPARGPLTPPRPVALARLRS